MSESFKWQCSGCKQLFTSEKNVKLHVNVHLSRIQRRHSSHSRAPGPDSARARESDGAAGHGPGPGRPSEAGGGRSRGPHGRTAPGLGPSRAPGRGPVAAAAQAAAPRPHWRNWPGPPAPPPANLYIAINLPRVDEVGGRARVTMMICDDFRAVYGPGAEPRPPLTGRLPVHWPAGGPGPHRDRDWQPPGLGDSGGLPVESDHGDGGAADSDEEDANWQEYDQEADCPEKENEEPGK